MDPYPTASDPAHDPVSDVAPGDRSESERISAAPRGTPRTPSGDRPGNRSEIERIPAATAEVLVPGPDRFPRVAELLTALEASGLVDRVDDPFDRRCIASFATERAQQMLVDARGRSWQIEDLQRELLRDLDVHQLDGVMRFLGRATDRAYRRSRQLRERPRPGRATRGGSG